MYNAIYIDVLWWHTGKSNVNIEVNDIDGDTMLMIAAWEGHLKVVRYLVEHGADVETKDKNGRTRLSVAASNGHLGMVRYLVEHGADIEAKDSGGWTALISAATNGCLKVVRYLVEHGADIEVKSSFDMTVLVKAANQHYLRMMMLQLVRRSADVELKCNSGFTALMNADFMEQLEVVQYLVEQGADKEAKNNDGSTALILAALRGNLNVVRYLVEQGVNKEAKNNDGWTALIWAARESHLDVVRVLVEQGANPSVLDNEGNSVLIHIVSLAKDEKTILPIVKQVLEYGCPPIHSNKNGRSAKSISRENDYHGVMDLIDEYAAKPRAPTHFPLQDWHISRDDVEKGDLLSAIGSFGVVYRGKWKRTDIVVKEIRDGASREDLKMFFREAKVWLHAQHKNIVRFYGANDREPPYFLISEFAPNGDLQTYLQKQKTNGRLVVWRKILDIAVGLAFLHSKRIIHGDLKGNNIVVSTDGTAMLTDFGLSFFEAGSLSLPKNLNPRWRAPEYLNGSTHRPSPESNIFSLGMCIVEIVTRDPPWAQLRYDVAIKHHLKNKIPMHKPECMSDREWSLVERMIAFDRTERISLGDAIKEIEQFAIVEANTEGCSLLHRNVNGD